MKNVVFLMVLVATGAAISGCQVNHDDKKYTYNYTENGCGTGDQEFSSQADMCAALQDDARNHYCAASLREDAYKQSCSAN